MQRRKTRFPGVYRLPDGRFWVRATFVCPRTGKRRDTSAALPSGATEDEALREQRRLRETLAAAGEPQPAASTPKPTVASYAKQWLEAKARRLRPSVVAEYTRVLADFILSRIGEVRLDELTRTHIEEWVAWAETHTKPPKPEEEEGERYARETVQHWWRILTGLVRDAVAELSLPTDPTARVRPPSPRVPRRREGRTLTAAELGALLDQVKQFAPDRHAEAFVLAFTGMRAGELFGLHWSDIDEERQRILVRRSVWRGHEDLPKTAEPREVALTKELATALREHRRWLVTEQHPGLETGLVFPSDVATHRTSASLHKALGLAAEAAKIDVRVTPQVLRRTFNTLMVHAGVDRIVLRSQMGHSSEEMTQRYAGVDVSAKAVAVGRLLELAGKKSG
jgi:integrase